MDASASISSVDMSRQLQKLKVSGTKVACQLVFPDKVRENVKMIIPSAKSTLKELHRALRKNLGRPYIVTDMTAVEGKKSQIRLTIAFPSKSLPAQYFMVLDAVDIPVLITDNAGILVFANDAAWAFLDLDDDPQNTGVQDLLTVVDRKTLPYIKKLPGTIQATGEVNGSKWRARVSLKQMSAEKCNLFAWSFHVERTKMKISNTKVTGLMTDDSSETNDE